MAIVSSFRPEIPLAERDRRYGAVRARLRERGVDCAVVESGNLFYLTNGLPGERYGILPTEELPLTAFINARHLVDVSPSVLLDAQEWVPDVRPADDGTGLAARLKELGVEAGVLGMSGLGGALGGFSQGFLARLKSELPQARLEDVSDIFADLRTIKSAAEIDMIERANVLFDLAVERVHATARPGMTGAALIQEGIKAMWEAGGDMDSTLGLSFGAVPAQNPILGWMSLRRPIQHGDIATLTAHAECGGYAGHSDAEISIGEPKQLHRDMFGAVVHVRRAVLSAVKPGNSHADLQQAYRDACQETGFRSSPHSQIHQYGIDVPEFPGPSFMDGGKGRNWRLEPGMVYSISPTLVAPESADTLLGGTCLVVTPTGYRELGDRKVELLVANK